MIVSVSLNINSIDLLQNINLNHNKKLFHIFLLRIRMTGKSINFDDKKINKSNFYKNKKIFILDDLDVNKILLSKKEPNGKKKFT